MNPAGDQALISVVIPTRDRPVALASCLERLAASTLAPAQYRIIVVDDGSREPLDDIVARSACAAQAQLLRRPVSRGPAAARNLGAAHARTPLVAFTDDDCLPSPSWLAALVSAHAQSPGAALGGRITNGAAGDWFCEASQTLFDHLYERGNKDASNASFFAGCNIAVPRDPFLKSGGFDESYPLAAGEDRAFCERWRALGGRLVYVDAAEIRHLPALGPGGFWRQHFRYGRGARRIRSPAPGASASRPPFESASFYVGILTAPFERAAPTRALPISALLAVSQLATACGYMAEWLRPKKARGLPPDEHATR